MDQAIFDALQNSEMQPESAKKWNDLGCKSKARGEIQLAIDYFEKAITLNPDFPDAYCNLANAYEANGQSSKAEEYYGTALRLNPTHSIVLNNLANIKREQGSIDEAIELYSKAVKVFPEFKIAHSNLGFLLHSQRKLNEAVLHYKEAIRIETSSKNLHSIVDSTPKELQSVNGSLHCCTRAIDVSPALCNTFSNLGLSYKETGNLTEAIQSFREALKLRPDHEHALCNLANVLQSVCDWTNYEKRTKKLIDIVTRLVEKNSDWMPMLARDAMLYPFSHAIRKAVGALRAKFSVQKVQRLNKPPYNFNRDLGSDRLRIGYVTSEFGNSSGAHLMQSIPGMHDRNRFEIFCYALNQNDGSEFRKKIVNESEHFIDLSQIKCHGEAADRIYADGIHILVDMIAYSAGGRPEIFALRPAPIQVMWLGYPGTSGADYMDYIVTDAVTSPLELQVKIILIHLLFVSEN